MNNRNTKTIIAIDPGKSGGIVSMHREKISTLSLKNCPDGKIIDFLGEYSTVALRDRVNCVVYLEQVGGFIPKGEDGEGQPGSRMFTFGDSYGYIRGVLDTLGLKTVFVVPQKWQRGIPGRKGTYSQRKRALRDHAEKLFPELDVTPEIADALGILHYARFVECGHVSGYGVAVAEKRELPSMAEQFVQAEAWCKRKGWAVPAKGTPQRSSMVDHWANGWLNHEPGF